MPTGQNYATNVPQTTLTGLINATATVASVNSSAGWPATPFTAVLDIGTSIQEPVDVTNITGTTWTIVRMIDGTTGFTHGVGATVTHGDIGRDFREARAHIDASGPTDTTGHSVHGTTSGVIVSTGDAQTLSNKTLAAPIVSGNVTMGSGGWGGTGVLTENALGVSGLTGSNDAPMRFTGVVTNGAPAAGTFLKNDMVYDQQLNIWWVCTSAGSPGTWAALAGSKVLLATNSPSGVGSFSFNSIPALAGYNHLRIEYVSRVGGTSANGVTALNLQFNGDSGTNYGHAYALVVTGAGSVAATTATSSTMMTAGISANTSAGTNAAVSGFIDIPFYRETTFSQAAQFHAGGTLNTSVQTIQGSGAWSTTGAVTSITVATGASTFTAGSTFNLYAVM